MKTIMAKILAVVMMLAIVSSMAVTSFAISSTDTGTITVSGVEDGVTVSVYQIITVNYDFTADQPQSPVYAWVDAVKTWIEGNSTYSSYADIDTFTSSVEADTVAGFYDALAAAIKGGEISITAAATSTGSADITGLSMGNYLVLVENGLKVYKPSAVNLVPEYKDGAWSMTTPAAITVKASELNIEKTVDDTQAGVGDTVNFTVVADVPQYPASAKNTTYKISDTPSAGLTVNETTIKVYGVKGTDETELTAGFAKTNGFTLDFTYATIKTYDKVKVTYSATVDADAVVTTGNTNTATLTYTNNPYSITDSTKDDTDTETVYTYAIKITKIDKTSQSALTGAEFKLYSDESCSTQIKLTGANGAYTVDPTSGSDAAVAIADDGTLTVNGLDVGTYYLKETKAPAEYNLPGSAFSVTVADDDKDGKVDDDGIVEQDIENSKGFQLPTTGGMGTLIFTIAGIVLIGGGLVLFVIARRKARA